MGEGVRECKRGGGEQEKKWNEWELTQITALR